jgi:hypothetical protein
VIFGRVADAHNNNNVTVVNTIVVVPQYMECRGILCATEFQQNVARVLSQSSLFFNQHNIIRSTECIDFTAQGDPQCSACLNLFCMQLLTDVAERVGRNELVVDSKSPVVVVVKPGCVAGTRSRIGIH